MTPEEYIKRTLETLEQATLARTWAHGITKVREAQRDLLALLTAMESVNAKTTGARP